MMQPLMWISGHVSSIMMLHQIQRLCSNECHGTLIINSDLERCNNSGTCLNMQDGAPLPFVLNICTWLGNHFSR